MRVNSDGKVTNLNADELDGKGANGLLRVASFNGDDSPGSVDGTNGNLATTTDHGPGSGLPRHHRRNPTCTIFRKTDSLFCSIEVDNNSCCRFGEASTNQTALEGSTGRRTARPTRCIPVAAGQHTVDLVLADVSSASRKALSTSLSALMCRTGPTAQRPHRVPSRPPRRVETRRRRATLGAVEDAMR